MQLYSAFFLIWRILTNRLSAHLTGSKESTGLYKIYYTHKTERASDGGSVTVERSRKVHGDVLRRVDESTSELIFRFNVGTFCYFVICHAMWKSYTGVSSRYSRCWPYCDKVFLM